MSQKTNGVVSKKNRTLEKLITEHSLQIDNSFLDG